MQVVVADTFDEIVNNPTKDVLIAFCEPSSEHCKRLAPVYEELAYKVCIVFFYIFLKFCVVRSHYAAFRGNITVYIGRSKDLYVLCFCCYIVYK